MGGYRTPAEGLESTPRTCSGCGGCDFGDLRSEAVYESMAVRDDQAEQSRARAPLWSRVWACTEGLIVVGILAAVLLREINEPWPYVAIALMLAHLGWGFVRSRRPSIGLHPARWRLSITRGRPAAPVHAVLDRRADEPTSTVVAPLSGRPCLGYEIGIREDGQLDAPDGTWLLLEQHVAPLRVAGRQLDGDAARLHLPRTPITADDRLASFLRRRGLNPDGRDLVVCESILEPGASVEYQAYDGGGSTVTRLVA